MGLKVQYRRPILTLCDGNYNRLGILSNKTQRSCYNVNLTKKVNEVSVLSFDIPSDNLIDYNSTELLVKFGLDYYIIKDVTLSSTDKSMYSVSAEHESTELKGILVSMISEDDSDTEIIGESPEGMWSLLVDSCSIPEVIKNKYIFETDIIDTYRSLEVEDEKGLYEHLVNIAKQFEACLVFEHNEEGKILIKLIAGEIDNKRVVKKGKDLRQLNITLDSSAIFTKIIPFGAVDSETGLEINIMDVTQDGKSYITNYDYYLDQGMTLDEIKNTPKCNQECIYRNSDIVDANELLRVATKELEQISKPVLHGNIDIINLGCMEGYFENTPVLCERIYVADKVGKYNIFSKVVGVSINYDNPLKSKVEISNVVRYSSTFADIVRTSEVVSKVTTKKKGKPVLSAEKVQGIIDAHTTQIKNKLLGGAEHQGDKLAILFEDVRTDSDTYGAIALGTSGILISSEKDINGEWLWTTAIDSQGLSTKIVNAITINGAQVNAGKISSFDGSSWWNLDNNEFNFGDKIKFIDGTFSIELGNGLENLVTKEDLEEVKDLIDEVDGRLDTALGDIDRAFKEGIIGEVEKRVIEKTLKTLLDQYSNAEYLYEIYKVSENLADETKTTLNARWRLYDASYTELTNYINEIIADEKCTETELVSYNLKVEEYYARYSELKNLLEDCQIEASNNYTNTKVSISEGNIKTEIESKYVKVDEAVNYTVICDNEHQGIPVDMLRKPLTTNTYRFNIAIYKGGAGTQQEFTIDSITGTGSGITYTKYDKYITMKVSKDTAISDLEGSIDVALTCNGFKFNKKITWNAVLNGEKGDSAEVVSIEASSLIFKYNNETQVYSPTNITLNPVFKNCAFQSWKYSINGGITYNTLATIDGITKDTNNKLTISSTCALFTSSVTSIQFKVTSSVGTTDQVTLTRLRDGLDGLDGLAGEKGADGKTYYTWVKYADTPTSGMSELPDGKTYIGLAYNKETNVESTNYADYKWSLIKGENGLDGEKGKDGKTYYTWLKYADTPTSGMSDDPTNKKYMGLAYNKESKIESTNYADYSWSLIKGNDGTNAINVVLSNESHTFVADHYGCPIPTSITNNVYGYSGTKQVNTNIGEIIGLPEGMSITVKNNNTTNTQIIINVAETMRIESGTISIPVICNGVTINKVFTYSLAKNGVDAKIVVINATSQVFKSTDGGVNYTPNSITVIASYQNCSHSKWQYSTNNDLTFRDLTNGTGGITVNGTTLTIPKTCSLFTSTSNCINIKAVGVDENVYDTVTIFKLLDRADINDVLDEQNSKITTVEEKYSTLEQDINGFKTEVGEKYTTKEEFNNLQIGGGDNLLRNGNFADGLDHWTIDNFDTAGTSKNIIVANTPSQWVPKNKNVLEICGLNTNERYGVGSDIMKLAPYTKYVISGYCAGHRVNKINITMRDVDNDYAPFVNKDISPVSGGNNHNSWYRFEIPFTTTANGNYVLNLYSRNFNSDGSTMVGYVWFTDVQVEEGTKATPWKKCILDITDAVDDVSNSVTNLNTYINDALEDKILDKTERQAIEQQLKVLEAEKTDINKEYTTLNSNAKLTGTPKTTLTSAYNDYISKYNALVTSINNILNAEDITVALKNSYNTAYTNHNNSLATYRQAYIDAFNSITTNYIETMRQALSEEIDDVSDSVTNLNTYVDGAFKDGILDNAEKHAIKQQLKTLSSEKADIDNEYTVVINDSDLTGTPKTNLTNAYNNYVSKYNSLVTSINNILNATLVTPTLRNSYDTAYTNHNSALATLKQRHTEAINAIAEAKVLDCTETITREYQSAIEQTKDEITLSVSETYATKTEMEQIGISGGDNLLKNGNFADGLDHWRIVDFGTATGTSKNIVVNITPTDWIPKNKSVLQICGLNTNERYGVDSANIKLAPYTKYVISGYCAGHRVNKITVTMRDSDNNGTHVVSKDITPVTGGDSLSKWYRFEIPFTTTASGNYSLCLYSNRFNSDGSTEIGYVWFTDVQLEQGTKATPWKKCIYDVIENIDDVSNSVTNLNAYIDGAFKDGMLDNTEKQAIKQQLKTLSAEKADIDKEVSTVTNNVDLTGTPKTNLTNAYNDYVSKYNALVTAVNNILNATLVTPTLRNSYDTAYTNHNNALATLKQRHMEAINAIAETKKQSSITTSKSYTDAQLSTTAEAIRGTVSQLREDFDNLEIGGENLLKNSEFVTTAGWTIATTVDINVDTSNRCFDSNSMKISESNALFDNYAKFSQTFATNVSTGQKFAVSGYYYVNDASLLQDKKFSISLKGKTGSQTPTLKDAVFNKTNCKVKQWTKFSFTTTLNQNYDSLSLVCSLERNGVVWFSRLQVERGDIATDYSPASTTYATKSEMELTSEEFKLSFQKSGSGNLLKNSDCQFGLNGQWVDNGGGLSIEIANAKPFVGSRENYFRTTFPNGIKYSETVYLKPNTDYVYQAYVYVGSNIDTGNRSPVHFWSWVQSEPETSPTATVAGLTILDYKQDVVIGEFSLCYIHFKTENIAVPIGFLPFIYSGNTASHVGVKQICLKEGRTPSIWIPHSSEINEVTNSCK